MSYIPEQVLNQSAFGDTVTTTLKPYVSLKAVYGLLDECLTLSATGGGVAATNSEFVMTTGTSVGGYGVLYSRQPVVYIPGVGSEARITARFTTGVANSLQLAGYFTAIDGMFFGYNGASFGVMHRHHGAIEIQSLAITTGAGGAETVTVTLNSVPYAIAVTAGTTTQVADQLTTGLTASAAGALWYFQHIGTTVVCTAKNAAAAAGTYTLASTGTTAGTFTRIRAGAAATETWTAKASWNVDTASWLDPTKGNLFKLEYAYLGYGQLKFSIFNPSLRRFVVVHVIDWANANTQTNFANPSLRVGWVAASLGSTTALTVAGGSAMAGLQGDAAKPHSFGAFGIATGVTTETQVVSILSRREFGTRANLGLIVPKLLSIGTDSTKGAIFKMYRNAVVAGVTTHNYVDQTQSIALSDTGGTTVSGGRLLGVYSVGPAGRATIDLSDINEVLISGDELTITAQVTSAAASEMTVSITWDEIV